MIRALSGLPVLIAAIGASLLLAVVAPEQGYYLYILMQAAT